MGSTSNRAVESIRQQHARFKRSSTLSSLDVSVHVNYVIVGICKNIILVVLLKASKANSLTYPHWLMKVYKRLEKFYQSSLFGANQGVGEFERYAAKISNKDIY